LKLVKTGNLFDLTYDAYDRNGNITRVIDNAASTGGGQTINYEYDTLSRLTHADATTTSQIAGFGHDYGYSAETGNFEFETVNGLTETYAYSDAAHPHGATGKGDSTYTYDANGNMITRVEDGITYAQDWTEENKLKQVRWTEDGGQYTTTYVYDGDGNRLLQIEQTPSGSSSVEITTLYIGSVYEKQFDTTASGLGGQFSTLLPDKTPSKVPGLAALVSVQSSYRNGSSRPDRPNELTSGPEANGDPLSSNPVPLGLQDNVDGYHDGQFGTRSMGSCVADGWARDGDNLSYRVAIRIMTDYGHPGSYTSQIASTTANVYRPDLPGVCTGGNCAFYVPLGYIAPVINSAFNYQVEALSMEGRWVRLNLSPKTLTCTDTSVPAVPVYDGNSGGVPNLGWWSGQALTFNWHGTNNASGIDYYQIYWGKEANGTNGTPIYVSPSNTYASWTAATHSQTGPYYLRLRTHSRNGRFSPWATMVTYYWGTPPASITETVLSNPNGIHECVGAWKTNYNQTLPYEPASGTWQNWFTTGYGSEGANFTSTPSVGWTTAWDSGWGKIASIGSYACGYGNGGHLYRQWVPIPIPAGYRISSGTVTFMADNYSSVYINGNRLVSANGSGTWNIPVAWITAPNTLFAAATYDGGGASGAQWQMTITLVETTPPTVWINEPAVDGENGWYRTSPTFSAGGADALSAITSVKVSWDGVNWYDSLTLNWDTTGTTLYARAVDGAGNSAVTQKTFKRDATAPANPNVTETHGVGSDTWQASVSDPAFAWSGGGDATSLIQGYGVDWGGITCGINTNVFRTTPDYDPGGVTSGSTCFLKIQAKDRAGNLANWEPKFIFKYDNSYPTNPTSITEIHGVTSDTWQNQTATPSFTWSGASAGSGIKGYYVYWGPLSEGTSTEFRTETSYPATTVTSGIYFLRVKTEAKNELTAPWQTFFTFRYDAVLPTIVSLSVPTTSGLILPVSWSATDQNSGVQSYDVKYQDLATGLWTTVLSNTNQMSSEFPVSDNHQYIVQVRAKDIAGNTSAWLESGPVSVKAVTKYYLFNGQRVAMRRGTGTTIASPVTYLHSDPLSSVSAITSSSGAVLAETRYDPFGTVRWTSGATVTDFGYTGQRADGMGLMDYGARFYDPYITQFTQPDSIIPDPYNPLDWNRYAYVRSNSLT